MFEGIDKVLKNQIDPSLKPIEVDADGYGQLRPIHNLDIANLIGANVVVGGVRRTSEIVLFDADDYEVMLSKYGINGFWKEEHFKQHEVVRALLVKNGIEIPQWFDEIGVRNYDGEINGDKPFNFGRANIEHRRMSNNSIAFTQKPSREQHELQFALLKGEGEPCFVNLEEGARRVAKAIGYKNPSRSLLENIMAVIGLNPCVEIILHTYNVCNLTTVNVTQFIKDNNGEYSLDLEGLLEAQRLSARIGLRMTLVDLELPHWSFTQQRDRLIGTSLTGWEDMVSILGMSESEEINIMEKMKDASRDEADRFAKYLRVSSPMLATTVKPEGTLSQVAKNPITKSPVSSGLHKSHAPYFIRRVRINSNDPLVSVAKELGWVIHAEVGTNGINDEKELASEEAISSARTLVIDFPVSSGAKTTKDDATVEEQFNTYFKFMKNYVEHNASNTITVKPNEWEKAEQIVYDNWDDFVGVSFLSHDGGTYKLAPYEAITKEEYETRKANMKPFDGKLLRKYEFSETEADMENMESCSSGTCPIR